MTLDQYIDWLVQVDLDFNTKGNQTDHENLWETHLYEAFQVYCYNGSTHSFEMFLRTTHKEKIRPSYTFNNEMDKILKS